MITRKRAVAAGAVAVLAARPVGVPAIVVPSVPNDGPSAVMLLEHDTDGSGAAVLHALGLLARAVVDELATDGTPADGGLTLVGVTGSAGQDLDQGSDSSAAARVRRGGCAPRVVQQRIGSAVDSAPRRREDPLPRSRDVGPWGRSCRRTDEDRAAEDRRSSQCGHCPSR